MGYYATGWGSITFARQPTNEESRKIDDILGYWFSDVYYNKRIGPYECFYDGKYHSDFEDDIGKLNAIVPIDEGCIEFNGEDAEHWKLVFNKSGGRWDEAGARLIYGDEPFISPDRNGEVVGRMIEVFEDFLERKGIDIENDEKEQSDNPAIIYGTDYGEIQSGLEQLLSELHILKV